ELLIFFFQAEDGIRDFHVTGVQTCLFRSQRHRLPPAFSVEDGQLAEAEPAGGGPLVGEPSLDLSHGELVSTAADYLRFLRALRRSEERRVGNECGSMSATASLHSERTATD